MEFDPNYTVTQYLDWLNMDDCPFAFYDEQPWVVQDDFAVLLSLEESKKAFLSDYFLCGPLTIISDDFCKVISEFNTNLELIPVKIFCGDSKELQFYTLHIMSIVDLIDREESIFAGIKYGMIGGITSLKLKTMPEEDIVFLKNTYNPITIVSDELRDAINAHRLSGMTFLGFEKYKENVRDVL